MMPGDDVAVLTGAAGIEHAYRHELHAAERNPRDSRPVVGRGRSDSGQPGSVAARVTQTVGAVQDRGAGDDLTGQVGVGGIDPGVEEGQRRPAGRGDRAEDRLPADPGECPLDPVVRVRGDRFRLPGHVHLDADNLGIGLVVLLHQGLVGCRYRDDVQSQRRDRRGFDPAVPGDDRRLLLGGKAARHLDDQ